MHHVSLGAPYCCCNCITATVVTRSLPAVARPSTPLWVSHYCTVTSRRRALSPRQMSHDNVVSLLHCRLRLTCRTTSRMSHNRSVPIDYCCNALLTVHRDHQQYVVAYRSPRFFYTPCLGPRCVTTAPRILWLARSALLMTARR